MKTSSSLLKTINTFFNIAWYVLLLFSVILIPLAVWGELPIEVKFSLNEVAKIQTENGQVYNLEFNGMSGVAGFQEEGFKAPFIEILFLISVVAITLFIFFQLKKLVNHVANGSAFKEKSYRHLRFIGFGLIAEGILETIDFFFIQNRYAQMITHQAITVETQFSFLSDFEWNALLSGLTFLVLAEVFKEGFSLKQETELTI